MANVKSQTLPVAQDTFPPQIIAGSLMATADGSHIFGIGGTTPDTGKQFPSAALQLQGIQP